MSTPCHLLRRGSRPLPLVTAAIALALMLAGCGDRNESAGTESDKDSPTVLARVGDAVITAADFEHEVARRRAQGRGVPAREAVLDELVQREAMLQRARSLELDREFEVRRELENLLIAKLRERELTGRLEAVAVGEQEIEAAYREEIVEFEVPDKVRLAIVFKALAPLVSEAKRAELAGELEMVRAAVQGGEGPAGRGPASMGFGKLAIDHSEHQISRYRGGDLGWLDRGRFDYHWDRAVLEAGYALEAGEVSAVIEGADGLYLVMQTDRRDGRTKALADVQATVRRKLQVEKQSALEREFLDRCLATAPITIDAEALSALVLSREPEARPEDPAPPAFPISSISSPGNQ